jgi:hypothetical protein
MTKMEVNSPQWKVYPQDQQHQLVNNRGAMKDWAILLFELNLLQEQGEQQHMSLRHHEGSLK